MTNSGAKQLRQVHLYTAKGQTLWAQSQQMNQLFRGGGNLAIWAPDSLPLPLQL
jgi:hypothetical protein